MWEEQATWEISMACDERELLFEAIAILVERMKRHDKPFVVGPITYSDVFVVQVQYG